MVETKGWKVNRCLPVESDECGTRRQPKETVMYWLLGCTKLAAIEFLIRHNNELMILCVHLGYEKDCWEKYEMV